MHTFEYNHSKSDTEFIKINTRKRLCNYYEHKRFLTENIQQTRLEKTIWNRVDLSV